MTVVVECPACLKPLPGGDRCVLRAPCDGPHYGEDDVAADWSPAAPCATCCVCPDCGSAIVVVAQTGGTVHRGCETCGFTGAAPGYVFQEEPT